MNLIEKLGLEKCKQIVDGAPEGYRGFNLLLQKYVRGVWFSQDVSIAEFKAQIDHHYYGRSEAEELATYAELSQEKIEGGAMLVGDFSKVRERIQSVFEDDRTDYVSDIRNHISPTTVVIER